MDDARFPSKRIWLVDSNPHSRDGIARVLEAAGWDVALFGTLDAALETAGTLPPALACIDAETSRRADSMRRIEAALPDLTCVVLIAANEIDTAVAPSDAVHEYVEQPVNGNRLVQAVERAAERSWLRKRVRHLESTLCAEKFLAQIAGESQAMRVLSEQVGRLGESNAPVCILGESGSGKDVVARALHAAGRQHSGALVTVSCTATPKALQAAELCGEERSSDASERLTGRFEDAQGGTLFFDEVSELSLAAQAALLGALRHRSFQRVGGDAPLPFTARVVCASQRDLALEVRAGRFHKELFQLLMGQVLKLPPLRDRKSDIPQLVSFFLQQLSSDVGRQIGSISPDALEAIMTYDWPGNVRELRNIVHRAMLSADSREITLAQLPRAIQASAMVGTPPLGRGESIGRFPRDPSETLNLRELERRAIQRALETSGGCVSHAARLLGIGRATIYRKLAAFDMKSQPTTGDLS